MPERLNIKLREAGTPPAITTAAGIPAYAELETVSNFSFLRGASHPDELVYRAAELGYRAVAITDINSLAGVVRAYAARKELLAAGSYAPQLIIGTRLTLDDGPDLLVWPTDRPAYARLCRLLTLGKRRAQKGECFLRLKDVLENSVGLLAAVAADVEFTAQATERRSDEAMEGQGPSSLSHQTLGLLQEAFGPRLSLAAAMLYRQDDVAYMRSRLTASRRFDIPLLATNHVHYHLPDRRQLQDVLVCVREGCTIHEAGFRLFANAERYLKSPEQMHRLFADHPAALARGLEIAEQCTFSLDELRYEYPDELSPPGMTPQQYLTQLTWEGAIERYAHHSIPDKVRAQIEHELHLIDELNFASYFLTVYDIVRFARSRGILCQGRGSAANSAVCYCIGVTSVDPARIEVLFERFISAARGEPPDIDVDFEHERREEVLQYIYEKYGRDRAGMTAEVITYRGRSAVRDIGKALGLSLDLVDSLAKKLDWWHRGTIAESQLRELGLSPEDPTIRQVVMLTQQALGFPRHLSQHVGGMVMTRGPLCELVPIENAAMEGRTVIEWDKDDIDALGILKVDVLGLGMLTCISKALTFINQDLKHRDHRDLSGLPMPIGESTSFEPRQRQAQFAHLRHTSTRSLGSLWFSSSAPLELHTIPAEDPAVYEMLAHADTIGVFQIESRAQMSMLPRLRPKCFYDLVIEVAIVRPGPIQGNMVHPYLRRRNGEEAVTYPSEAMRQVLEKTLGVPLFQEQAMRVAMVGAGFSAGEADQLRRAMAAWRRNAKLETFRQKIVDGMLANGYTHAFAEQCYLQIRGFGEYGFPESHAASFALLVYASAWLKCYYPAEFAAALINSQPMGFYAPAQIVRDAQNHGVEVRPVDVNESNWDCTLEELPVASGPLRVLRLGFRLVKGLRQEDMNRLVTARKQINRFKSVADVQELAGLSKANLRKLAEADAFGSLGLTRRQALWHVLEVDDHQWPLFADVGSASAEAGTTPCPQKPTAQSDTQVTADFLPPMPLGREVIADYSTTGLSLKRHPVALIREQLRAMRILSAKEIADLPHGTRVKAAGIVLIRQRPGTASGIVFVTIEDETGVVNLIIRPNIFDRDRQPARHADLLQAEGRIERQGEVIHLVATRLTDQSRLLSGHEFSSRDFH